MPLKRRAGKRRSLVTAAAIEAFRAGDRMALFFAIGQKPWEPSPLEVWQPEPPEWASKNAWTEAWPKMYALRLELMEAIGQ
ncbi:hypothetical protein [Mesorhizobium sp. CN2-181]|uniref:hypothetical protein n=1 Tax=Mesorhizobium yinganensis TaxID=3157707 RepID=UPI0032B70AF0